MRHRAVHFECYIKYYIYDFIGYWLGCVSSDFRVVAVQGGAIYNNFAYS